MLLSTQHHAQSVCDLSSSAPRPAGAEIGYIIFKCAGYACGCVYGGPLVPDGEPVDTFCSYIRVVTSSSRTGTDWIGFFSARFRAATVRPSGGDVLLLPLPSLSRSTSPPPCVCVCACLCVLVCPSIIALLMETRSFVIATKKHYISSDHSVQHPREHTGPNLKKK